MLPRNDRRQAVAGRRSSRCAPAKDAGPPGAAKQWALRTETNGFGQFAAPVWHLCLLTIYALAYGSTHYSLTGRPGHREQLHRLVRRLGEHLAGVGRPGRARCGQPESA